MNSLKTSGCFYESFVNKTINRLIPPQTFKRWVDIKIRYLSLTGVFLMEYFILKSRRQFYKQSTAGEKQQKC